MAVAFLDIKAYSRKRGPQAHSKAAYDAADKLITPDGTIRNFKHKSGVVYSALFSNAAISRQAFWDAVELSEKRKDACTARGYAAALPAELTREQNIELAQDFALHIKQKFNLAGVDLAVHYPDHGAENPHLHLLHPDRDARGRKLNFSRNHELIFALRHEWEEHVNAALEQAGKNERIDMRNVWERGADILSEHEALDSKKAALENELAAIDAAIARKKHIPARQPAAACTNGQIIHAMPLGIYTNGTRTRNQNLAFSTDGRIITNAPIGYSTDGGFLRQNNAAPSTNGALLIANPKQAAGKPLPTLSRENHHGHEPERADSPDMEQHNHQEPARISAPEKEAGSATRQREPQPQRRTETREKSGGAKRHTRRPGLR